MAQQPVTVDDLLAAFRDAAAGQRVVVERDGQQVALIPAADLASLLDYEAEEDRLLGDLAQQAKAEWQSEGGRTVAADEVFRRAGLD